MARKRKSLASVTSQKIEEMDRFVMESAELPTLQHEKPQKKPSSLPQLSQKQKGPNISQKAAKKNDSSPRKKPATNKSVSKAKNPFVKKSESSPDSLRSSELVSCSDSSLVSQFSGEKVDLVDGSLVHLSTSQQVNKRDGLLVSQETSGQVDLQTSEPVEQAGCSIAKQPSFPQVSEETETDVRGELKNEVGHGQVNTSNSPDLSRVEDVNKVDRHMQKKLYKTASFSLHEDTLRALAQVHGELKVDFLTDAPDKNHIVDLAIRKMVEQLRASEKGNLLQELFELRKRTKKRQRRSASF